MNTTRDRTELRILDDNSVRHLALGIATSFQDTKHIPSTLIKGQSREGGGEGKTRKCPRGKETRIPACWGRGERGKKKGENEEEGTARYRKFESSHRGSGCCFIMRCTHLLQPPRTSWYLFLVRSLHTAVCVKRTVCSMQSSRDRCIVESVVGLSSFCQDSQGLPIQDASTYKDFSLRVESKILLYTATPVFSFFNVSFPLSLFLSLSLSVLFSLPAEIGIRRLIIAATWLDKRGWSSKIRLVQRGFTYFPSLFIFPFSLYSVSRMGESSEESCCPRADELLMPDHCLGHVPIRKNSPRYDILNSVWLVARWDILVWLNTFRLEKVPKQMPIFEGIFAIDRSKTSIFIHLWKSIYVKNDCIRFIKIIITPSIIIFLLREYQSLSKNPSPNYQHLVLNPILLSNKRAKKEIDPSVNMHHTG